MNRVSIKEASNLLEEKLDTRMFRHRFDIPTKTMKQVFDLIEPYALANKYLYFYNTHEQFAHAPAGARHHHWWDGGLEVHIKEMMGFCFDLMEMYPGDLQSITKSDIIICCFLHDFAKIWTYVKVTDEDRAKNPGKYDEKQVYKTNKDATILMDDNHKTLLELAKYEIVPTDRQWSAVLFSHGGYSDGNFGFNGLTQQANSVNTNNPLAVMMQLADMYSSQFLGKSLMRVKTEPNAMEQGK